ncbi:hypothetical protein HK099_002812 [Clydaea vesicula]|uniref:Uncharacterized protein n=1 Tax=Clydaea vesicula TaxID=447962 RepID=A0AAD5U2A5_9FUNG|nr:hypothetical protein HK099_002812 [Clydaea vesicula]
MTTKKLLNNSKINHNESFILNDKFISKSSIIDIKNLLTEKQKELDEKEKQLIEKRKLLQEKDNVILSLIDTKSVLQNELTKKIIRINELEEYISKNKKLLQGKEAVFQEKFNAENVGITEEQGIVEEVVEEEFTVAPLKIASDLTASKLSYYKESNKLNGSKESRKLGVSIKQPMESFSSVPLQNEKKLSKIVAQNKIQYIKNSVFSNDIIRNTNKLNHLNNIDKKKEKMKNCDDSIKFDKIFVNGICNTSELLKEKTSDLNTSRGEVNVNRKSTQIFEKKNLSTSAKSEVTMIMEMILNLNDVNSMKNLFNLNLLKRLAMEEGLFNKVIGKCLNECKKSMHNGLVPKFHFDNRNNKKLALYLGGKQLLSMQEKIGTSQGNCLTLHEENLGHHVVDRYVKDLHYSIIRNELKPNSLYTACLKSRILATIWKIKNSKFKPLVLLFDLLRENDFDLTWKSGFFNDFCEKKKNEEIFLPNFILPIYYNIIFVWKGVLSNNLDRRQCCITEITIKIIMHNLSLLVSVNQNIKKKVSSFLLIDTPIPNISEHLQELVKEICCRIYNVYHPKVSPNESKTESQLQEAELFKSLELCCNHVTWDERFEVIQTFWPMLADEKHNAKVLHLISSICRESLKQSSSSLSKKLNLDWIRREFGIILEKFKFESTLVGNGIEFNIAKVLFELLLLLPAKDFNSYCAPLQSWFTALSLEKLKLMPVEFKAELEYIFS